MLCTLGLDKSLPSSLKHVLEITLFDILQANIILHLRSVVARCSQAGPLGVPVPCRKVADFSAVGKAGSPELQGWIQGVPDETSTLAKP